MRTIGKHVHGSTRGEYPVMCSICGVAWPRKQLRYVDNLLICPDEGDGMEALSLQRANLAGSRSPLNHVSRLPGAAFHDAQSANPLPNWEPGDQTTPITGPPDMGAWFVSNSGSDTANTGRSSSSPFLTIAHVQSRYLADDFVFLERGSTFYEQVVDFAPGVRIGAYGTGARPIIDGRDTVAVGSWSKTGGRANVYETPVTHNFGAAALGGENVRHRMWEDGSMMNRAADLASCDATPGTFFANTPTMGPDLVYVHPSDNGNPATNGKVYKASTRQWCINLRSSRNHGHVQDLEGVGNAYGTGPFSVDGSIRRCTARDGQTHNVYIRGLCEDVDAIGIEPSGTYGGSTSFVTHADANSPWCNGRDGIYRRCRALPGGTMVSPVGGTNASFNVGFYCHFDGGLRWGSLYFEDCYTEESALGIGGGQLQGTTIYRGSTGPNVVRAVEIYPGSDDVGIGTLVVLGGSWVVTGLNSEQIGYTSDFHAPKILIMRGVRVYKTGGSKGPVEINIASTTATITRCTFATNASGGIGAILRAGIFTFNENVMNGNGLTMVQLGATGSPLPTYIADHNCYWNPGIAGATFQTGDAPPIDYVTLAAWRTATGQEANSLAVDPLLANPAGGDFTIGNSTVAAMAGAKTNELDDATLQALLQQYKLTDDDL